MGKIIIAYRPVEGMPIYNHGYKHLFKKMSFLKVLALIILILLQVACEPYDLNGHQFQKKIQQALLAEQKNVSMRSLTDFDWDTVCVIQRADDSVPPDSLEQFLADRKYIISKGLLSLNDSYRTAFLFIKNNTAIELYRIQENIQVNGKEHVLAINLPNLCGAKELTELSISNKTYAGITTPVLILYEKVIK